MTVYDTQWYMDTDFCDMCGAFLDEWGICPVCGWDGVEFEDEYGDDEFDYGPSYYVGQVPRSSS